MQKDRYDELRAEEKKARAGRATKTNRLVKTPIKAASQMMKEQKEQEHHPQDIGSGQLHADCGIDTSSHSITSASSCPLPSEYYYCPPPPLSTTSSSGYQHSYGTNFGNNPSPSISSVGFVRHQTIGGSFGYARHQTTPSHYAQEQYAAHSRGYEQQGTAPSAPEFAPSQGAHSRAHPPIIPHANPTTIDQQQQPFASHNDHPTLDQLQSDLDELNRDGGDGRTRELCDEVDISDEEIRDAYHTS